MLCMDKLFLQAIAGKNFLRIPIDITYYYGVSVWIRIPINTMSCSHNPIRSDERSTANMASTDTERDLPWPWMGCCILTVNHARGERSLATSWEEELVFLQYWQALFQKTRMFLKLLETKRKHLLIAKKMKSCWFWNDCTLKSSTSSGLACWQSYVSAHSSHYVPCGVVFNWVRQLLWFWLYRTVWYWLRAVIYQESSWCSFGLTTLNWKRHKKFLSSPPVF